MLVRDVMTKKVHSLGLGDSFGKIVRLLIRKRISGAPVKNKNGKVVGVVSEKDLFYQLFPSQKVFYKDPQFYMNFDRIASEAGRVRKMKARTFMSKKIIFLEPDDHVLKACSLFIKHQIRRIPVLDKKKKLVGIVTTNDVYKSFLAKLGNITQK